jgi:hypothetical protein
MLPVFGERGCGTCIIKISGDKKLRRKNYVKMAEQK